MEIWKRVGLMYCVGNFVYDAMLLSGWICHVQVMDDTLGRHKYASRMKAGMGY